MADLRPLHKAMVRLGTIILPLGLILARQQGLRLEEQRRAAKRQLAAAPRVAVPRVARVGVEAAAWVVAPTVAVAGVQAAVITKTPLSKQTACRPLKVAQAAGRH
jgi:hypothetical protein